MSQEQFDYEVSREQWQFIPNPERSEWKCYMFGNTPQTNDGIVYHPLKGAEPNWFVRRMMKICFACTWVKEKKNG